MNPLPLLPASEIQSANDIKSGHYALYHQKIQKNNNQPFCIQTGNLKIYKVSIVNEKNGTGELKLDRIEISILQGMKEFFDRGMTLNTQAKAMTQIALEIKLNNRLLNASIISPPN